MDLKKYIVDKSKDLDIDIIGFTNVNEFEGIEDVLKVRREKNYETEFEENDIKKRVRPKEILETGKSIIVIGVSYYKDINNKFNKTDEKPIGRLSISSVGTDYHMLLTEKMEKLASEIKKVNDSFEYKVGVDTTPLLDRQLAKRAGIGWYGKNSNIINDIFGSFIFLGYIISNLAIEEDSTVERKCGECDICIRSCPVGAIKPNHELDATKCISYLTQTKREIPYNLREKMGDKIYGCDTCQLVCPKNEKIIKNTKENCNKEDNEDNKDLISYIEIEELFNMSNREFKDKYGDIAFSWRGKNVIKRNGIIILGNKKDKTNIPLLLRGLKDESVMIRKYSAWSLLKIDKVEGIKILEQHIEHELDKSVIEEIEKLRKYFEIS